MHQLALIATHSPSYLCPLMLIGTRTHSYSCLPTLILMCTLIFTAFYSCSCSHMLTLNGTHSRSYLCSLMPFITHSY